MKRESPRANSQALTVRRAYAKPALQKVRLRTASQQLARVDALNHCTAHIHDDAAKSPCNF